MLRHTDIWRAIDELATRYKLSPSGLAKKAGLDPTTFNKSKRITPEGRPRWPSTESVAKSLAATGCGKYSWSTLSAVKSFKDANVEYARKDWRRAAEKYEVAIERWSSIANGTPANRAEVRALLLRDPDRLREDDGLLSEEEDRSLESDARREIEVAWAAKKLPIITGGTGLYFKALEEGHAVDDLGLRGNGA